MYHFWKKIGLLFIPKSDHTDYFLKSIMKMKSVQRKYAPQNSQV